MSTKYGFIVRGILEKRRKGEQNLQECICHLLQVKIALLLFIKDLQQESTGYVLALLRAWQLKGSSTFAARASGMGTAFIEPL